MKQKGFTLVELLLATAFFSFILLFVVVGFVQINRQYTKGVTVRRVQNNARSVLEDITRSIRDSEGIDTYNSSTPYRICIGDLRYGWNQNTDPGNSAAFTDERYTNAVPFQLVKDYSPGGCNAAFVEGVAEPMIDDNVAVQSIELAPIGASSWRLSITLSSAERFDLTQYGTDAACDVGVGDQYCDVAKLETVISVRN